MRHSICLTFIDCWIFGEEDTQVIMIQNSLLYKRQRQGRRDLACQASARRQSASGENRVEAVKTVSANSTVLLLTGSMTHICKCEASDLYADSPRSSAACPYC